MLDFFLLNVVRLFYVGRTHNTVKVADEAISGSSVVDPDSFEYMDPDPEV